MTLRCRLFGHKLVVTRYQEFGHPDGVGSMRLHLEAAAGRCARCRATWAPWWKRPPGGDDEWPPDESGEWSAG